MKLSLRTVMAQSRRSVSERSQEGLGAELARTSRTCREYCALDHRSNSGE